MTGRGGFELDPFGADRWAVILVVVIVVAASAITWMTSGIDGFWSGRELGWPAHVGLTFTAALVAVLSYGFTILAAAVLRS